MTKNSIEIFNDEAQIWIEKAENSYDAILKIVKDEGQIDILWNFISSVYSLSKEAHKLGVCFAEIGNKVFYEAKEIQAKRNEELGLKYPGNFADIAGDCFIVDEDGFLRLDRKASFENRSKKQTEKILDRIKYGQEEK